MGTLFNGVIQVTGEKDTGKSTFAIECGVPIQDIALIGDDVKDRTLVDDLEKTSGKKFGLYVNLLDEIEKKSLKEIGLHNFVVEEVIRKQLKSGNYKVIIFDTWGRFESTLYSYVMTCLKDFKTNFSQKGDIKGAEQWAVSFDYESRLINEMREYCGLLILVSHLKTDKYGISSPASKRPLNQNCDMRIWLRHNPNSPAPIGLVLKRIAKRYVDPELGVRTISVLPKRIVPCTWDKIREYWNSPVGNRPLLETEVPNEFEVSLMEGILTADQKDTIKLMQDMYKNIDESEEETKNGINNAIAELLSIGKSYVEISSAVGLPLPEVIKIARQEQK